MYSWKHSDPYNTIIWAKENLTVFKWVIEQKIKLDFNAFFVQSPRRKGVSGNHLMVESCCTKTWSIHAQLGHFKFVYVLRHFHWCVIFKFLLRISNLISTKSAAVATFVKARRQMSVDTLPLVSRSNPGAAAFAFAKLRKRDFRRLHPQVRG